MFNRRPKHLIAACLSLTAAALLCGTATPAADAAISYQYATDLTSLTLSPGQLGTVNLYLVETTTDGTPSRFATEDGLSSAYVGVNYVTPTPPASPLASPSTVYSVAADVTDFNDIAGPDDLVAPDHLSSHILEFTDISEITGPAGTEVSPGVRQVFLGSVTVLAGTSPGTTTFHVEDDPSAPDTVTIDGYASPLDANPITPATFTITVPPVPEPTSLSLLSLATLPLLRRRRTYSKIILLTQHRPHP